MTRRRFALLVAAPAVGRVGWRDEGLRRARLMRVHDLEDFARRMSREATCFQASRVVVRAHSDYWPGPGAPRRWEAWLEEEDGGGAVRVVADPAHRPAEDEVVSEAAGALARRLASGWVSG